MNRPALALSLSFAGVGLALAGDDAASKVDFHTDRGTPEKLALLVGIADYPEVTNREWADLEGSVNDTLVLIFNDVTEADGLGVFKPERLKATWERVSRAQGLDTAKLDPETVVNRAFVPGS